MTRRLTIHLSLVVSLTGLVLSAAPAAADYGPKLSLEQLAAYSAAVARGRVYSVDAAWDVDAGNIYTYVRVDVAEVLAGPVAPRRIILKQLGGVVGDVGQYVGGQATFRPGEQVVVFLELRPRDATVYTTSLWQGKWTVSGAPGAEMLHRNAGFDADGHEVLPEDVSLAQVHDAVRAIVRPAAREPASIRFVPPEAPAPENTVDRPAAQKIPLLGFSWHEAFSGSTVRFNFHKSRQKGVGTGKRQLRKALQRWTAVKRTLPVERLGRRRGGQAPGTALRDPAGVQDLLLQNNDPQGDIGDDGGTLAVGGAWFFNNIAIRTLSRATSGFIVMNDSAVAKSFLSNKKCYQNVVTHEDGHTAGLDHSNKAGNLMFPSITEDDCKAGIVKLGRDDQRFYRKIYNRKYARQ